MKLRHVIALVIVGLGLALFASAVSAAEVGRYNFGQGSIVLTDQQSTGCDGERRLGVYVSATVTVPGCWFRRYGIVWMHFADGDTAGIPEPAFGKAFQASGT